MSTDLPPPLLPNDAEDDSAGPTPRTARYYGLYAQSIGFKYWDGSFGMRLLGWTLAKVFRSLLPVMSAEPPVDELAPFEIDGADVPAGMSGLLDKTLESLRALGFESPAYYMVRDGVDQGGYVMITMGHPTRPILARFVCRGLSNVPVERWKHVVEFVAVSQDGAMFRTCSTLTNDHQPERCTVLRVDPTTPVAGMLQQFEEGLRGWGRSDLLPTSTKAQSEEVLGRLHRAEIQAYVVARVMRPLTPLQEAMRASRENRGPADHPNSEVYAAIDASLKKRRAG